MIKVAMGLKLRREMEGTVTRVTADPYDKDHHAWVELTTAEDKKMRLLVTHRFREEHSIMQGQKFSWKTWNLSLLNFLLLNPVQDITDEFDFD